MTRSLRRSRRATTKKGKTYQVGDLVEIVRGNVTLTGRLEKLLTEGTSPNPRWLVVFDGQAHKDEEVFERSFRASTGTEEGSTSPDSMPPPVANNSNRRSRPTGSNRTIKTTNKGSTSSEEGSELVDHVPSKNTKTNKKSVSFSESSPIGSDESSAADAGKISAREQRSRRRQAKIDEDTQVLPVDGSTKRRLPQKPGKNKRSRPDNDNEVVKVKLLTGTLYLYRGLNRRAEFVRRV